MAPVNQGMYEFKKDSLTEIRKRMGVSQNKMAELLGVPANTLSRWETGATVPDAGALAAIYSLAREQGVDSPLFFGIRSSPLELKTGSKPSDQSADPLSFFQSFQRYLNTQIELIGTELAPALSIEIRNTAPSTPDWPKIVFTEVGLSLAHTGGDRQALLTSRLKIRISRKSEEKPSDIAATPWQHDSKREGFLKIPYARIDRQGAPAIRSYEAPHGGDLFPGQSIIYEMDVTSELLPYLQFKVEGTVSRRHLLHYEETFAMPENITKPMALSALHDFYTIDLYGPLESVINSIPKFDSSTRLEEVQTFSKALSDNMTRIKATQEELSKVVRQHKLSWFRAHIRAAFIYLERVNATLVRTNEAIGANSPDKIASEVSALLALRGESAQLDRETKELMRTYNISEEEVK
jgi:transcriptional regulator with XRE-family HTH domain